MGKACVVTAVAVLTGSLAVAKQPPREYVVPAGSIDMKPLHWKVTTNHGFSVTVRGAAAGLDLWKQALDGTFTHEAFEAIPNLWTHQPFDGGCGSMALGICDDIFRVSYDPTTRTFEFEQLSGEPGGYQTWGVLATYTRNDVTNPGRLIVAAANANATAMHEVAVLVEPEKVLVFEEMGGGQLDPTPTVVNLPAGTKADMIVMRDVVGDGKAEILVGSTTTAKITVVANNTPFTSLNFSFLQTFDVPGLLHFDVADTDGTGKGDIVAVTTSDELVVALNTNGGTPFSTISSTTAVDSAPEMIALAELLPADARPDAIVLSNPTALYSTVGEFTNGGTGTFVETGNYANASGARWLQASSSEFAGTLDEVPPVVTIYPMSAGSGLSPAAQILAAGGADPGLAASVQVRRGDGSVLPAGIAPYGATRGAKVGSGDIDGATVLRGSDEVLTGPGPSPSFGPHVRGFLKGRQSFTPMGKVSFYGYGTLRWGVNVVGAQIDGDAPAEIVAGPGPGTVFGPHLRAFNFDGVALSAISKVNAFAYSTLKYGLEVGTGDVDDDGSEEILTGPGPGAMFGAQARGWNYDGQALTSMGKINFLPFGSGASYGCTIAGGDVDEDGIDEILTGRGAGPAEAAEFRGFNFDGQVIAGLAGFAGTLTTGGLYGCRVAAGDIGGTLTDAREELLVAHGPDPAATSHVETFFYDGTALSAGVSFESFPGFTYGANVSSGVFGF